MGQKLRLKRQEGREQVPGWEWVPSPSPPTYTVKEGPDADGRVQQHPAQVLRLHQAQQLGQACHGLQGHQAVRAVPVVQPADHGCQELGAVGPHLGTPCTQLCPQVTKPWGLSHGSQNLQTPPVGAPGSLHTHPPHLPGSSGSQSTPGAGGQLTLSGEPEARLARPRSTSRRTLAHGSFCRAARLSSRDSRSIRSFTTLLVSSWRQGSA